MPACNPSQRNGPQARGPDPGRRRRRVWLGCLAALGVNGAAASEGPTGESSEPFAPTVLVRAELNAVTGALRYGGSAVDRDANSAVGFPLLNAFTLNHDSRLTVDASFTGRDLVRLRLRSGNFGRSGFFSNPPTPLTRLDVAFQEPLCEAGAGFCNSTVVTINRAYLQAPLGREIHISAGSRIMQVDMLPVWPSVYNEAPILELFQRAGSAGVYSRRLGSGFGAWWKPKQGLEGLSLAYAYLATQGNSGNPEIGGLFTAGAAQTSTVQVAFTRPHWNLTAGYSLNGQRALLRGTPLASQLAAESRGGSISSWSLAGYWQPLRRNWLPAISAGLGYDRLAFSRYPLPGLTGVSTRSWSVGLNWSHAFGPGNSLLMAMGAPAHVTRLEGQDRYPINDAGLAFELATRILLTDTFSLTPAVFWLTRPRGAMTATADLSEAVEAPERNSNASLSAWGALVRATLRF